MSALFSTICRNCGATIYGHKVLIETLLSNPLNNSFLSAQAVQTYYVGFRGLKATVCLCSKAYEIGHYNMAHRRYECVD